MKTENNIEEIKNKDVFSEKNIVEEVKNSFLEYSVSVIKARALPDLRDGLKPVHRRILWSMYEKGYTPDKPPFKSAKTVGEVMGNYHPHGDASIYDAMVRLAQDFNQRYVLIDGQGNFGNIDGDGAAAMRYTEARLSKLSLELLRDIDKNTIDMDKNFDELRLEPHVLPSRYPNILVNGTMGIAVGMATNIPPHNLSEVIDGCVAYIDNHEIDTLELMQYIKGPDFPTGGIILGNSGIKKAYETGRGSITIRSKAEIITEGNHDTIVITEVPYGVNTMNLKTKVAELVNNKVIEGISDYHTDLKKDGVKITITLKRDANAQVILNNLYKLTNFQISYGIILLMLDGLTPKTLPLKDIIVKYIDHQKEVIIRRTQFDLEKSEVRVHLLEGFKIALDNIDEVIRIIKESEDDKTAKEELMKKFNLDEIQTDAILEMKLRRLTNLERNKVEEELKDLLQKILELKSILADSQKVLNIIKEELLDIKQRFGDERRTKIDMTAIEFIEDESLIPEENIMIMLTNKGYVKRTAAETFKVQNRGGVGVKGISTNDEDFVDHLINLSTHDYVMFFSNRGKVYRLKGYEVPEYSRVSKGLPIINLLPLEKEEKIASITSIPNDHKAEFLLFATKKGIVKKTLVEEFESIRKSGKICITLREGDELLGVKKCVDEHLILLGSSDGKLVKFDGNEVRPMGRNATGVKGITLDNSECICLETVKDDDTIIIVTEKGYGKQTKVSEYRQTKRGSKGVKALNMTEKTGKLIGVKYADQEKDLILMTNFGTTMRMPISQISTLGRVTQGVKLINLKSDQTVAVASVVEKEDAEDK